MSFRNSSAASPPCFTACLTTPTPSSIIASATALVAGKPGERIQRCVQSLCPIPFVTWSLLRVLRADIELSGLRQYYLLRRLLIPLWLFVLLLFLFRLHRSGLRPLLRCRSCFRRRRSVLGLRTLVRRKRLRPLRGLIPVRLRPIVRLRCGRTIRFGGCRFTVALCPRRTVRFGPTRCPRRFGSDRPGLPDCVQAG